MRITLVGALAIAGVALLVLLLLNLRGSNAGEPDDPSKPPEESLPPALLGLSAEGSLHPGA
jgi:hypothetical protein